MEQLVGNALAPVPLSSACSFSPSSLPPHCSKRAAVSQSNTSSFKMRDRRSKRIHLRGCLSFFQEGDSSHFPSGVPGQSWVTWTTLDQSLWKQNEPPDWRRPITTQQAPLGPGLLCVLRTDTVLTKHKSGFSSQEQGEQAAGDPGGNGVFPRREASMSKQTNGQERGKEPPLLCSLHVGRLGADASGCRTECVIVNVPPQTSCLLF